MGEASDHYATLGLSRKCTPDAIRTAYRLLAKMHHPDVSSAVDAAEKLQAINAAYEILEDPERRAVYDRELLRRERPAPSLRIERNISQDVFLGVEEFLRGVVMDIRVADPANPCGLEIYTLVVPEETAPGTRFRLPRDEPFLGGFVIVRVKPRPNARFKVRGSDLRTDLRISAQRAANGGTEMIPGALGGMVRVTIPPNAARGAIVRVVSEGLPRQRGGRGDLLVRISYRPEVRVTRPGRGDGEPTRRLGGFRKL